MSAPRKDGAGSSRRGFLKLGAALAAGSTVAACAGAPRGRSAGLNMASKEESLRIWEAGKGVPYELGDQHMPGVCQLPGPNRKVRFPDPDKYKGCLLYTSPSPRDRG